MDQKSPYGQICHNSYVLMCTYRPAYRVQVPGLKPYISRIIGDPRENLIYSFVLLEEEEEKFWRLVDITNTVALCISG